MAEDFDDFARKLDQDKKDNEKLHADAGKEWSILKDFVLQFAREGKEVDGHKFEAGPDRLILNYVAATFLDSGTRFGVPQNCRVRFDRREPGPGKMFFDDSPVNARVWTLNVTIDSGEFLWFVPQMNLRKTAAELASEIAKELVRCHLEYQKAFSNWTLPDDDETIDA